MPLLSTHNLSLTIGAQRILHQITLHVAKGEVVGIIGPNGSGKTTLLNVLSGLLRPTSGTIQFQGKDVTRSSAVDRAHIGIGRVFQNFGIFREMTLAENILVALEALPRAERKALGPLSDVVDRTLAMVHLSAFATKKASSLSGGQMRLLEIARTLACGRQLFLLDEPTAGVSPKMTNQVAEMIRLLREQKKTVIVIEHDLPFIQKICDRVVVLDLGEIVLEGTPSSVRHDPKLKELYFGADPTD